MRHFRADKNLRGDAPAPVNRPGTAAWAISVALHMLVFTLAADTPWFIPLEIGAPARRGALPVQERIAYLAMIAPEGPTTPRRTRTLGATHRVRTGEQSTASDQGTPHDSVTGGGTGSVPASVTTPLRTSAPIVNAPVRTRVWLSLPRGAEAGAPGSVMPSSELRIGLRAAIAAAADSIARAKEKARAATDWTLKTGSAFRLGVSPMRLHLGLFEVPVPVKVVSLRDFDRQLRTRRLMLAEVYEQRDRAVRDSIITESIAAVRARSKAQARSPQ